MASTIPCSTPTNTTTPAVVRASTIFAGALAANGPESAQVHQPDGHNEHDGAQHASRKVLQRVGEEEKHQRNHRRGGNVRHLAPPTGAFHHGGLSWTSVHHERAAERRRRVRRGKADQVRVLVQGLMVCARRKCGRLPRSAQRSSQSTIRPREPAVSISRQLTSGHAQMRQAAGHRPNDGDAARGEVPGRAGRNRARHGDQRSREFWAQTGPRVRTPATTTAERARDGRCT